nr:MAG TPA_asm: hypothetical protein [Caudoviricetes sp.]DAT27418.1 MAG TPA: hypothetical protein [Caudoviricetes sp.]
MPSLYDSPTPPPFTVKPTDYGASLSVLTLTVYWNV